MAAKRLRYVTELWCVHPHGKRPARSDRCPAGPRSKSIQQRALRFRHALFVNECELRRRALCRHMDVLEDFREVERFKDKYISRGT